MSSHDSAANISQSIIYFSKRRWNKLIFHLLSLGFAENHVCLCLMGSNTQVHEYMYIYKYKNTQIEIHKYKYGMGAAGAVQFLNQDLTGGIYNWAARKGNLPRHQSRNTQSEIHKYKYGNTKIHKYKIYNWAARKQNLPRQSRNTKIHRMKFTITSMEIRKIHRYKCTNTRYKIEQ